MFTCLRRMGPAAVAVLAVLGLAPTEVQAQPARVGQPLPGIQPFFRITPNLTIAQAAYNTALLGRAYSFVPPYAMGYFPPTAGYVPPVNPFVPPPFVPPLNPYVAPYTSPYTAAYSNPYGGYASNPYSTASLTSSTYGGTAGYDQGAYGGGYPSYGESQYGGFLRGAADVINSQGRLLTSIQQANILKEQYHREKIENRRRVFDQWLDFRKRMPTAEDERKRTAELVLSRSLNDAPDGDVLSGNALNVVMTDLQKLGPDRAFRGPAIPLDEEVLRHINVNQGGDGNIGLLKNEGRLNWPLALRSADFATDRELLDTLTPEVIKQAVNGRVDAGSLREMGAAVERIRNQLRASIRDLPPGQYMEANRFLASLDDALRVLQRPNAGNYFTQVWAPQGKTVGELVQHMISKGLRFTGALPGDEAAYRALYRALVGYHSGTNAQVATTEKPPEKPTDK